MILEYKREDEKPEKIQKIIDCFEITKHFKYHDVTIEERQGDAEIIFSKLEFEYPEYPLNFKAKIYFTKYEYFLKENENWISEKYSKEKILDLSTFLKDLKYSEYGEKSLRRCELPEILKNNSFISETFQELFFPELDLSKD